MSKTAYDLTKDIHINGQNVHIRPIESNDIAKEKQFVENLSPESKHFRFLGSINHLTDIQATKFCDIDYDDKMAFIALIKDENGDEKEIGVSRYATDNANACECAVAVADAWQHHGIGRILMTHLIEFARSKGKHKLYSIDLADNNHMHKLAKDLGMNGSQDLDDAAMIRYEIVL